MPRSPVRSNGTTSGTMLRCSHPARVNPRPFPLSVRLADERVHDARAKFGGLIALATGAPSADHRAPNAVKVDDIL